MFGIIDKRMEPNSLLVTGNHDECVAFMRKLWHDGQTPEIDFDLYSVTPAGNGMFDIGIPVSYVL